MVIEDQLGWGDGHRCGFHNAVGDQGGVTRMYESRPVGSSRGQTGLRVGAAGRDSSTFVLGPLGQGRARGELRTQPRCPATASVSAPVRGWQ